MLVFLFSVGAARLLRLRICAVLLQRTATGAQRTPFVLCPWVGGGGDVRGQLLKCLRHVRVLLRAGLDVTQTAVMPCPRVRLTLRYLAVAAEDDALALVV